ncbi:DUF5065 domain-containing protein [Bacillus thuringiensis]|nr:DUF5065 domain-containing protein [Bacillus thuringiensis]PES37519.1 DUF5065 domain-containing protein [Bacillus thuringiensis]PEV61576.1 DUF5065 domain-containing protein [Bacillus thuringiensis]PFB91686.1 DUF5065 domain-containing protein [Bacillus thuringiensis]PFD57797.1 DUF5065 domain-containing protein [Bacillus thuringiensis]
MLRSLSTLYIDLIMNGDLESSKESTYQPDWKIGNLITGDTFYLTQYFGAQMKIFKVHTNGTLERFQTIEPELK